VVYSSEVPILEQEIPNSTATDVASWDYFI